MSCPGSLRMIEQAPPALPSPHAQEGTAAHALAELSLRRGLPPETWVGATLEGVEITHSMAEHVRVFVDYCRDRMGGDLRHWIEAQFNLAPLNPPGPMFGTADFVSYNPVDNSLEVVDLKFGQGVYVDAVGNPQLRYYALGALMLLPKGKRPDTIFLTIVQPRLGDPPIRSEVITRDELRAFAKELLDAARATQAPDAPLVAGDHCRFCPAAAICPEYARAAQAVAQVEFDAVPLAPEDLPPAPETLPDDLFAEMLSKLDILENWIVAMRRAAHYKLTHGQKVEGMKLVAKRATRRWRDEDEARQWLRAEGYSDDEIQKTKLLSPHQIEKLVGRRNLPADLVESVSSGYAVVPESDPRPAAQVTAGEEFPALPSGGDEED